MTEIGTSNRPRYLNSVPPHRSLYCLVYLVANDGESADCAVAFLRGVWHIQWVRSISPFALFQTSLS